MLTKSLAILAASATAQTLRDTKTGYEANSKTRNLAEGKEFYDISAQPQGLVAAPILDTAGANCNMNVWFYLALFDSLTDDYQHSVLTQAPDTDAATLGTNNGAFAALQECAHNPGIQKLLTIDALASKKPAVLDDLFGPNAGAYLTASGNGMSAGDRDLTTLKGLYDSNFDFYKQYWKYELYSKMYSDSGLSSFYNGKNMFDAFKTERDLDNASGFEKMFLMGEIVETLKPFFKQ